MRITSGKVVAGKVVVEGEPLAEGATVTVLAPRQRRVIRLVARRRIALARVYSRSTTRPCRRRSNAAPRSWLPLVSFAFGSSSLGALPARSAIWCLGGARIARRLQTQSTKRSSARSHCSRYSQTSVRELEVNASPACAGSYCRESDITSTTASTKKATKLTCSPCGTLIAVVVPALPELAKDNAAGGGTAAELSGYPLASELDP